MVVSKMLAFTYALAPNCISLGRNNLYSVVCGMMHIKITVSKKIQWPPMSMLNSPAKQYNLTSNVGHTHTP